MPRRREPTHAPGQLRAIARYQRLLIVCLLGQIVLWVGYNAAVATDSLRGDTEQGMYLTMAVAGVFGLVGGVLVFLQATQVNGPVAGVLLGLLAVVPCFGLVILLIANVQATGVLQAHGVRVGLFGAKRADLANLREDWSPADEDEDEGW